MCSLGAIAHLVEPSVQIYGSATLSTDGSIVYIGSWYGLLYAVHTANGTQKWIFPTNSMVSAGVGALWMLCGWRTRDWLLAMRCGSVALLDGLRISISYQCSLSRLALCVCVYTGVLVSM